MSACEPRYRPTAPAFPLAHAPCPLGHTCWGRTRSPLAWAQAFAASSLPWPSPHPSNKQSSPSTRSGHLSSRFCSLAGCSPSYRESGPPHYLLHQHSAPGPSCSRTLSSILPSTGFQIGGAARPWTPESLSNCPTHTSTGASGEVSKLTFPTQDPDLLTHFLRQMLVQPPGAPVSLGVPPHIWSTSKSCRLPSDAKTHQEPSPPGHQAHPARLQEPDGQEAHLQCPCIPDPPAPPTGQTTLPMRPLGSPSRSCALIHHFHSAVGPPGP